MVDVHRLCAELLTWQGVPWQHQGRSRAGVDCVGLALVALAEQGAAPSAPSNYHPSAAADLLLVHIAATPLLVERAGAIAAGDVLVFRIRHAAQHLAVALGPDRLIHAVRGAGVVAVTLSALWRARLVAHYGWVGVA